MKKNPKVILIIGVIALLIGAVLHFTAGSAPAATAEQEAACREQLAVNGEEAAAMAHRCDEAAVAIGIGAQRLGLSAPEAAQAIAAANQGEVGGSMLSKFLLGFGLALTVIGGIAVVTRKNQA